MSQPNAAEIGVGTVIADTYEVTHLLGQGGMGAVWAASHRRLPGKRVAVKVLLNASKEGDALARFRREAEIASRLGHPNIVEVIDFHTTPSGTPYMILELLEGESLSKRLKRGPVPLAEAMDIVRQVGSALQAAHREGVVHRDLKPDNIFLCPTDSGGVVSTRVKVLDFGISKIRGSQTVQTQESALLGTPQYMSPEQAFGRNKTIDQRTDIFALGAIVYEMLTGTAAFHGETLAQVILAIVHEQAPSLVGKPGIPDHVAKAVDRALQKEPSARFDDVAQFVAELTGRPMQTLDRRPIPSGVQRAWAETEAARVDVNAATVAPTPPPSTDANGPPSLATLPRGETTVPPTANVPASARGGRKTGIIAAAVGGLLAVGGVAAFVVIRAEKQPVAAEASKVAPVEAPKVAAVEAPKVEAPKADAPKADAPKADAPQVDAPKATATPKSDRPKSETLPPSVAADLAAAEKALERGDAATAIHLARRSLTEHKTSQASALIARAYCRQGDLGNANANLRAVGRGPLRDAVVKDCKKFDVHLQ
jgi:serine/threonine-protein kinase